MKTTYLAARQVTGQHLIGGFLVFGLHAFVLSALWHYRLLPVPDTQMLFVNLLSAEAPSPPAPAPPHASSARSTLSPPPPHAIEPPKPVELQAQPPMEMASAPTPLPPPPSPVTAAASPATLPVVVKTFSNPVNAMTLATELSVSCPQRTPPRYPNISKRLGEQGKVILRVELAASGQIEQVKVVQSSGYPRLDEASVATVSTWHCAPALRDGVAIRAIALQPFNFVIEGH